MRSGDSLAPHIMQAPQGSIVALSAASATILSMGMIFLGYWGFMEPPPWTFGDFCVIVPALIGLTSLGFVPWIATTPVLDDRDAKVAPARHAFLIGVGALLLSIVIALYSNTLPHPPPRAPEPPAQR
jgi:hypothetical protein